MLLTISALAQDQPRTGDGEIRGRVIIPATGQAAPGVSLQLTNGRGPNAFQKHGVSGADGRFSFEELLAGRYELGAFRNGYESGYAQVGLESNTARADVEVSIEKTPVVTGRVLDSGGRPAEGARVTLYQKRFEYGAETLRRVRGGGGQVDDRGVYRVYMLPVGDFVATVAPPREPSLESEVSLSHSDQIYQLAGRLEDAQEIRLDYDAEVRDVDFEIGPAFEGAVRLLTMIPEEGAACARCDVRVSRRYGALSFPIADSRTSDTGQFAIHGLAKGSYTISGGRRQYDYRPAFVFRQDFEVTEAGVQTLSAPARKPVSIEVEVEFRDPPTSFHELPPDQALTFVGIELVEESKLANVFMTIYPGIQVERDAPKGVIEQAAPGLHRVRVDSRRHSGYLQTLRFQGQLLQEALIHVPARGRTRLQAVMAFDSATISGSVRGSRETPLSVEAIRSSGPGLWDRFQAPVRADGSFQIRNLPPGEYDVLAYARDRGDDFANPATGKRYSNVAERVVVEPNGRHSMQIERIVGR